MFYIQVEIPCASAKKKTAAAASVLTGSDHDTPEESGTLTAHEGAHLPLLPSGPGGVHKSPLRKTRPTAYRGPTLQTSFKNYLNRNPLIYLIKWRRVRDLNPRGAYHAYTISSRAPSAARTTLRVETKLKLEICN